MWVSGLSWLYPFYGVNDHLWLFPSLALSFSALGFVFVGDGLRDALDPRLR